MRAVMNLVIFSIGILLGDTLEWTDENRRIETDQIALWESKLTATQWKSAKDRVIELSPGLRNMGYRMGIEGHSPEVKNIYQKIQRTILSIPEHAEYFKNAIESERKRAENFAPNVGPRVDYDRNRLWYFHALEHLPSPETIMVLGDYLSDERDLYEMTSEETAGQSCISGGSTGNSTHSAMALEKSELRDKPYRPGKIYDNKVAKAVWREWWEQVKSGSKTFSFVGQTVEYRFKPDGTWETIPITNPPDDGPKFAPVTASERPIKRPSPALQGSQETSRDASWWWYVLVGSVLLALGAWLWSKNRTA